MKLLLLLHLLGQSPDTVKIESLQLSFGTLGSGVEASFTSSSAFSLRAGLNYIAYKKHLQIETDTDSYLHIYPDMYNGNVYALADYHLLKKQWLRLTGGLAYAPFQHYSGFIFTEADVKLGELTIPYEEFGNANLEVRWNRLKPYLGLGVGRRKMKNRVGIGADLGFYYLGSPRLLLDYEGFLETTTIDDELAKIQQNMRGYRFYPYVAVQVRVRMGE